MRLPLMFKHPTKERVEAEYKFLRQVVNAAVSALNTIVGKEMYDAVLMLRKTPLYRQRLKAETERAYKEYEAFERYAHRVYDEEHYKFFLDYLDCVEDETVAAVKNLREKIRLVMVRYNEEYPELKACFITARTLTDVACNLYDGLMSRSKEETCVDFTGAFLDVRLTKVQFRWHRACSLLFSDKEGVIDLVNDPDCLEAYKELENLLGNEDTLNNAGRKAIMINPGIYNNLSDEDKKIIDNE